MYFCIIKNIIVYILLYILILNFKYKPDTFVDFINNKSSVTEKNKKILSTDKKDEQYYINRINELDKVKTLENTIKEMENNIKEKDLIINENLQNQIEKLIIEY